MTSLAITRAAARRKPLDRAVGVLASLITFSRRRRALDQLLDLDDRMLRDVGLTRFDVQVMRRPW